MQRNTVKKQGNHRAEAIKIILFIVVIGIAFGYSCYVRRPSQDHTFYNADATYHVLQTMMAYDDNPVSSHIFLPILTFGDENNKFIENGPSLMMDANGNSFYVTFPALGFALPYLFCKIAGCVSIDNLYLFNSLLMAGSATLIALLVYRLTNKKLYACISGALYIAIPEVMASQGIVYWHQSLSQVFLLTQLLSFVQYEKTKSRRSVIALLMAGFLYACTEWSGYVSNLGIIIALLCACERRANGKSRRRCRRVAVELMLLTAASAVLTALPLVIRFGLRGTVNKLLFSFGTRGITGYYSIKGLIQCYFGSYNILLFITLLLLLLLALLSAQFRQRLRGLFCKRRNIAIAVALLFPNVENIILLSHAQMYTFDRLKLAAALIVAFVFAIDILIAKRGTVGIAATCFLVAMTFTCNLYNYDRGNYRIRMYNFGNTDMMKNYITEKYDASETCYVKHGWRAWGYLQSLYEKNFICTDYYDYSDIIERMKAHNQTKLVILLPLDIYSDKCAYVHADVIDINTNECAYLHNENGTIVEDQGFAIQAHYLGDAEHANGVNMSTNDIIIKGGEYVLERIADYDTLSVNGTVMSILGRSYDGNYVHVEVDGNAGLCQFPIIIKFS